ncbi:hypothetical protein [Luteibacter sp. 22Crub2.1]|uniref:hypothetical protein n=1 Tax=Luteibacter sp. 22Crub2.1 TaxID=1283288 RepID=UPI0009A632EB|nr:hypothetical protein [Luteibacter sp. 22Crub2.1]SKB37338.1 hypothetical protein SAMN05660880_00759 [Luteibacter sp. 22Crub2.1]
MGVSVGWLAVKGKDGDAVLAALDLVRNEQTTTEPRRGYAIELPSGWFVVVTRFASPLIAEESLRPLSRGCTVITCEQEEHVMVSAATCYVDGLRTWHVEHDGEGDDVRHIVSHGEPPPAFDAIHARIEALQDASDAEGDDVDHFYSLPPELAQSVTTFDVDLPASAYGKLVFTGWTAKETLAPGATPQLPRKLRREMVKARAARPWWKFW